MLLYVFDPNHHTPAGRYHVLPLILLRAVTFVT